jgi:hypothetical protein
MNQQPRPAEVALAYPRAFSGPDMATAARYIADDIAFESPRVKLTGAGAYLAAAGQFAEAVTGVDTITAFGDDDHAIVMYDMHTSSLGIVRAADYFEIRNGKITADKLVFGTYEVRRASPGSRGERRGHGEVRRASPGGRGEPTGRGD